MKNDIYISLSAISKKSTLDKLKICLDSNIKNIEIGPGEKFQKDIEKIISKFKLNCLFHNYVFTSKRNFVINLASLNKSVLSRSIEFCKKGIELSKNIGAKIYSFHAGFRIDISDKLRLGKKLPRDKLAPYKKAYHIFVDSVRLLCNYAHTKNIRLAVEPNVITKSNLLDVKNRPVLICDMIECSRLLDDVGEENLGLLLDLGHLKVTSNILGFDKFEFVERLKNNIFIIHIHDNDGMEDEHKIIKKDFWFLKYLRFFKGIPLVIESWNMSEIAIKRTQKLIVTNLN